jgi:hypothetical protein
MSQNEFPFSDANENFSSRTEREWKPITNQKQSIDTIESEFDPYGRLMCVKCGSIEYYLHLHQKLQGTDFLLCFSCVTKY